MRLTFHIEVAPEDAENLMRQLAPILAPFMPDAATAPRALMSCKQAGKDLGIDAEKVRTLVHAGLIDRVPGFTEIRISPEALAKYRATPAPK